MKFNSPQVFLLLLSAQLVGCGDSTSVQHTGSTPPYQVPLKPSSNSSPVPRYTWTTAKTGPGCMPKLRAMMDWYTTQADDLRQIDFVPGEPTDGPVSHGPYQVDMDAVNAYLKLLRKSGYFSDKYIMALEKRAHNEQRNLQHAQPPADVAATIADFPLFPRDYDDMLEQKASFRFSAEKQGKVIVLNDAGSLLRFTYSTECKIDSFEWVQANNPLQ